MPVLKKKTEDGKTDEWYIHIPNKSGNRPPVYTIQVEDVGRDMLLDLNLNHKTTDNRKADIDWDLFYTLDDLGLLYTLGSDYEPSDATPSSQTFKHLEGLSDTQRAQFSYTLLDEYEPHDLFQHEHIVEFFLSLETLPEGPRHILIDRLLDDTPFGVELVETTDEVFDEHAKFISGSDAEGYNPILICLIAFFIYDNWDDNPDVYDSAQSTNECAPIWVWDDWVAFAGGELMYHSISSSISSALPEPIKERALLEGGRRSARFYDLLEVEFCALWTAQTIEAMSRHNWAFTEFAKEGIQNGYGAHCLILPRPANHEADYPGAALDEAAETEPRSKSATTIRQMFRDASE